MLVVKFIFILVPFLWSVVYLLSLAFKGRFFEKKDVKKKFNYPLAQLLAVVLPIYVIKIFAEMSKLEVNENLWYFIFLGVFFVGIILINQIVKKRQSPSK